MQVVDGSGVKREGRVTTVSWVSGLTEMRESGSDAGVRGRWTCPLFACKVGCASDCSKWTYQVSR